MIRHRLNNGLCAIFVYNPTLFNKINKTNMRCLP